jgi:hypothetical protein
MKQMHFHKLSENEQAIQPSVSVLSNYKMS